MLDWYILKIIWKWIINGKLLHCQHNQIVADIMIFQTQDSQVYYQHHNVQMQNGGSSVNSVEAFHRQTFSRQPYLWDWFKRNCQLAKNKKDLSQKRHL